MEKMSDKQKRDLLKAHEEDIENYANDLFVFSQKIRNVKVSLSPERFGKLLEYDNLEPDSWNHSTGEIEWDNGYFFQSAILKVPKKKLEMIIRNFELAIQTNMNNPDINLSGITFELPESFQWWELDTLIQLKFRMNQIQTIYNDICMASGHENIFNHNQLNHSKKLEQSKSKNKIGRKKVEVKNAKDYLTFDDMKKDNFIDLLKKEYSNCEPKTMNHLILVLIEETYLKKVTNKELKESFCEILNVEQSQTNFDNYMNGNSIDESLKKSIKKTVSNLIFENSIV